MEPASPYRTAGTPAPSFPIEADTRVFSIDLRDGPTPPFARAEAPNVILEAANPGVRMRSAETKNWSRSVTIGDYDLPNFSVRVRCRLDGEPNGVARVWFRHFNIGTLQMGYLLSIRPLLRQYRISRYAGAEVDVLSDWSTSAHISGPLTPNLIEVAARDHQMMVVCNGELITLFHDASFGRGAVSVGGTGPSPRDAIIFESVELFTVRSR
jgi:hypothetical protein